MRWISLKRFFLAFVFRLCRELFLFPGALNTFFFFPHNSGKLTKHLNYVDKLFFVLVSSPEPAREKYSLELLLFAMFFFFTFMHLQGNVWLQGAMHKYYMSSDSFAFYIAIAAWFTRLHHKGWFLFRSDFSRFTFPLGDSFSNRQTSFLS